MAVPASKTVFVNVPFDDAYDPLFTTLIGTLFFVGRTPRTVLEIRETGEGRLSRIFDLMRRCRISIHDLSRSGNPVRFNMPFELGLAYALKLSKPEQHEVLVLDARPFRLDRILSDYKGRDPLIHRGTCEGVIACVLDAFETNIDIRELSLANRALRRSAQLLKRRHKSDTIFRPSLFRILSATAKEIAIERGFTTPA